MFTGLIEELGQVERITKGINSAKLDIKASKIMNDLEIGDSVAINGACQTVVKITGNIFTVEAMAETLDKTNLGHLVKGEQVNLERALRYNSRLGGHLVSGHVDAVGIIDSIKKVDIALIISINAPEEILKFTAVKGSIAVDGISLTVVNVEDDKFSVSLIPHTAQHTTLGIKKEGDIINIEVDLLARYIARLLNNELNNKQTKESSKITIDWLQKNGYA